MDIHHINSFIYLSVYCKQSINLLVVVGGDTDDPVIIESNKSEAEGLSEIKQVIPNYI